MTKRIYIAIRVKQYQYIFYLKAKRLVNLFTVVAWSFLLLAFVLPTIGIGCLAVNDSHSLVLPLKQFFHEQRTMSLPSVSLRVKKQEKYLAKSLANNTHFNVDEIEGLFNMYRQEIQQYFEIAIMSIMCQDACCKRQDVQI